MKRAFCKRSWTLLPLLALLSGCYERTAQADQITYRFAWYVGMGVVAASLAVLIFVVLAKSAPRRARLSLGALGLMGAFLLTPSIVQDRFFLRPDGFQTTYGIWFAPHDVSIRYADLQHVTLSSEQDERGRTKRALIFSCRNGEEQRLPAGDLIRQVIPELLEKLKEHQIPVDNEW